MSDFLGPYREMRVVAEGPGSTPNARPRRAGYLVGQQEQHLQGSDIDPGIGRGEAVMDEPGPLVTAPAPEDRLGDVSVQLDPSDIPGILSLLKESLSLVDGSENKECQAAIIGNDFGKRLGRVAIETGRKPKDIITDAIDKLEAQK